MTSYTLMPLVPPAEKYQDSMMMAVHCGAPYNLFHRVLMGQYVGFKITLTYGSFS